MSGLTWLLVAAGAIALVDGFSLAVKEEARLRDARIVTGVVTRRSSAEGLWTTWMIDYRFPCRTRSGTCAARDLVSRDLWGRLRQGERVRVRQADGEVTTARLDENPQNGTAMGKTAFACVLFALACLSSGRLRRWSRTYATAAAVVTAVKPVTYGADLRWRVHFAYFDEQGCAQESVDEVNDPSWKVNDECVAVYRTQSPDLATLQPLARS